MIRTIVIVMLLSSPAAAGSLDAAKAACMLEVWSICASEMQTKDSIVACLRREQARLTPACRDALIVLDRELRRGRPGK